jgi:hypothetical protein
MRRALGLLAAIVVAAASAASAQAHAITLAHVDTLRDGTPQVAVHVSNLLDDPEWLEPWQNAYVIRIHWKVQVWRNALIKSPQRTYEWDVLLRQVPQMDLFNYTERISGRQPNTISFRTLDSLKAHLVQDVGVPALPKLAAGQYFFRIDVTLSTSEKDPFDTRTSSDVGAVQKFVGLFSGGSHAKDLPTVDRNFVVH